MPGLGKSPSLWYRVQYRSDGSFFDSQGYSLLNKVQGDDKELKVGSVVVVKYAGKLETCDVIQVGRTRKDVWQETAIVLNEDQSPGNTETGAEKKSKEKSVKKDKKKAREVNKKKNKENEASKENGGSKRNKENKDNKKDKAGSKKNKKKKDTTAETSKKCSQKTLQQRQRMDTQRGILSALEYDPENNASMSEGLSDVGSDSELILATRKNDVKSTSINETADISNVLTRLSSVEEQLENQNNRISNVESTLMKKVDDNSNKLDKMIEMLFQLRQSPPATPSATPSATQPSTPPPPPPPQPITLQQPTISAQSVQAPQPVTTPQLQYSPEPSPMTSGLLPPAALRGALKETDARKATKVLLLSVFGKEIMASHTFRNSSKKPALDRLKTTAIIDAIIHNYPDCHTYRNIKGTKSREASVGRFIGDACQDQARLKERMKRRLQATLQDGQPSASTSAPTLPLHETLGATSMVGAAMAYSLDI